ncbi:sensor histidine kinase [Dactylosporangium darangshiense]|uniref:sensor histidine kinase n=1 Tax=Dactylosporangium darangshiense TaxID=579108 RepID=UPI00363826F6
MVAARSGLSSGAEDRLADLAALTATAIANAAARDRLRRVADEQEALRRVATLVARGVGPNLVFAAVAQEVGARIWGAIGVASRRERLPSDTEQRMLEYTDLITQAIANAEARSELAEARARLIAVADETRRRIERDLHDGAQQRLVSLALQVRRAQAEFGEELDNIATGLTGAMDDLRELARGIHPATLTESGLRPALKALARRSSVPVELDVRTSARLPEPIEVSAYYVVAEALTNVAKHAQASVATVTVETADEVLRVSVRDDGVGGANLTGGTGLAGLKDRVEALGGRLFLDSPPGAGTALRAEFPLANGVAVT